MGMRLMRNEMNWWMDKTLIWNYASGNFNWYKVVVSGKVTLKITVFVFVLKFKIVSPPLRNYLFQIEIKNNETSIKELSENDGT